MLRALLLAALLSLPACASPEQHSMNESEACAYSYGFGSPAYERCRMGMMLDRTK